jgi:hypothetical protein
VCQPAIHGRHDWTRVTAADVLRSNDRGGFTVPSGSLYPYQWLWDSAFIALGWSTLNRRRAWDELDSLMRGQWPDGMLPHVVYHHPSAKYFPDPDLWGVGRTPATSAITQPPVLASVVLRLVQGADGDREDVERARRLWPGLLAFHRWVHSARDPEGTGLICSYHPWETGMDNSPPWDEPLSRVPVDGAVRYDRMDTEHVPDTQRPTARDYDRYVAIVTEMRSMQYDPTAMWEQCSFKVADVGTNAIAARADADLAALAEAIDADSPELVGWARASRDGLQQLWDKKGRQFLSLDLRTGEALTPATSASLLPCWAGMSTAEQQTALADSFDQWRTTAGAAVPSCEPASPAYDPNRYWRGPVWVNINWMIADGLGRHGDAARAAAIAGDTRRLIEQSGMREYFNPATGEGLGAADFGWTAALARYWLGME